MFKVDMSYRKRSLDMPMSGEPQSVKYPRADSGAATAAAAAAAATPPAAGRDPSSALPPIRSLPEFNRARYGALAQPQQSPAASTGVIPPIRHLHISTPSPISPSHERSFPHHLALPPPPVQTSAAYPVITHSQPRQQQQSQQHTQVGYEFHQKLQQQQQQQQGSRISGGYPGTGALPQPSPPSNMDSGTGGHNPFGQGSSPLSSLKSANSPPATMGIMGTGSGSNNGDHRVSRMDLLSNAATIASSAPLSSPVAPVPAAAATRGTATVSSRVAVAAAKTTPEAAVMAQDHEGGTGADTIKVARNWSRDETLSLVRAIGRHYESLKRCKTNQERSNVWHRIHKEHSGQFPGRSKKASQVRESKSLPSTNSHTPAPTFCLLCLLREHSAGMPRLIHSHFVPSAPWLSRDASAPSFHFLFPFPPSISPFHFPLPFPSFLLLPLSPTLKRYMSSATQGNPAARFCSILAMRVQRLTPYASCALRLASPHLVHTFSCNSCLGWHLFAIHSGSAIQVCCRLLDNKPLPDSLPLYWRIVRLFDCVFLDHVCGPMMPSS
ncbi:hypothetical protein GQ54DRAFT_209739 [Martensiomyces pterosporus]|nr:hypothetical protein GQ54DRAFT_209739 [Martensiomyces pterosporus]